ncbi:MAG TPA: hypothetical protein VM695_05560 [Phycisphaerae bacterium]|nr:hypothetical protein [Phycisphaerae bacterium]
MTAERLLKLVLLLCGLGCVCGLPGLYMPAGWMARAHEWLGMGEFPSAPIAEYLARLTSGLYAMYGGLVVLMATDVRRFAPLITAQALMLVAVSASSLFYAWGTGIPTWWLIGDIAATALFGGMVLVLQRKVRAGTPAVV